MTAPLDIKNTDVKVEVSEFQGKMRVDIRKWYQDKNTGEWKRTAKGLNITLEEWESFKNQINDISSYIKEEVNK
jgi:hypothetical protein